MSAYVRSWLPIAVLVLAASAAASCGDDEEADPSPTQTSEAATRSATPSTRTPTAQPSEAVETGGMEGFRVFAAQIEAALQAGDEEFFVQRAETSSLVCPNEFEPRCSGEPDGSSVEGVWLANWQSEGSLLTPEDFRTEVSSYLDSLSSPILFALATDSRETGSLIGDEPPVFFAIVGNEGDPIESVRVFELRFAGDEWRLTVMMTVPATGQDDWVSGVCADCYEDWERWEGS